MLKLYTCLQVSHRWNYLTENNVTAFLANFSSLKGKESWLMRSQYHVCVHVHTCVCVHITAAHESNTVAYELNCILSYYKCHY